MGKLSTMCFLGVVLGITASCVSAEFLDAVSRVTCKGKSVYVPVDRKPLQGLIDTFTGPTLYMPGRPVMPGQPEGTHPMLIDVAEVTFKDFVEEEADNPNSYVSTVGVEITVTIPYLAVTAEGPATVSLGVAVLYDARRRGIPQPDFLFDYLAVEQITMNEDTVTVVDGKAEITIDLAMGAPCENVPSQTKLSRKSDDIDKLFMRSFSAAELLKRFSRSSKSVKELLGERDGIARAIDDTGVAVEDTAAVFDDTAAVMPNVNQDISGAIFSLGGYPYVDFCWFYKEGRPRFCRDVDIIRHVEDFFGANMCSTWSSDNEEYCATKAGLVSVSGWFQHIIPIAKRTQTLGADKYNGDYSIGLKFPCVVS